MKVCCGLFVSSNCENSITVIQDIKHVTIEGVPYLLWICYKRSSLSLHQISKSNVVDDMVESNDVLYRPGEKPDHCVNTPSLHLHTTLHTSPLPTPPSRLSPFTTATTPPPHLFTSSPFYLTHNLTLKSHQSLYHVHRWSLNMFHMLGTVREQWMNIHLRSLWEDTIL